MSEPLTDAEREDVRRYYGRKSKSRRLLDEVEALRAEVANLRAARESDAEEYAGAYSKREGDALKAENERLKAEIQLITAPIEAGGGLAASLRAERNALKAENERLKGTNVRLSDECLEFKAKLEAAEAREEALAAEVACFRRCLWVGHGHRAGLYGDDGEMQCAACAPAWDYKRHDPMTTTHAAFKAARADERRKVAEEIQEAVRSEDFHGAHKRVATWAARFVRKHGGEQARRADREE
jgi:hypothetical protein